MHYHVYKGVKTPCECEAGESVLGVLASKPAFVSATQINIGKEIKTAVDALDRAVKGAESTGQKGLASALVRVKNAVDYMGNQWRGLVDD